MGGRRMENQKSQKPQLNFENSGLRLSPDLSKASGVWCCSIVIFQIAQPVRIQTYKPQFALRENIYKEEANS